MDSPTDARAQSILWRSRTVTLAVLLLGALLALRHHSLAQSPRQIIARALIADDPAEQVRLVGSLAGETDPLIPELLTKWKGGEIFLHEAEGGAKVAILLVGEKDASDKFAALRVDSGEPLNDPGGKPLRFTTDEVSSADTDAGLRIAMKSVLDLLALADPDPAMRLRAVSQLGLDQDLDKLPALELRAQSETEPGVRRAFREAIALIQLKSDDPATQVAAAKTLGELGSIPAQDVLKTLAREGPPPAAAAAQEALGAIAKHLRLVNTYGTVFRGLSLGSVLLVVAMGLAITFGLMGVINMAHGELIAIGAYTAYVVQNIFGPGLALSPFGLRLNLPGFGATGMAYDAYFLVALPMSFLVAALVGLALERGVIQFLYRRPLESLLATWGVSLVLQQLLRLTFGASNVQVDSPVWLSGNWTFYDVIFGWNRVFVIGFATAIIIGTWLLLSKTSFGLLIRAVTQNRAMASCLGVRTARVNMLTFAFGSGLAGLAGAFLSQLGNVGPGMGQEHIVGAFMTVVVGGVGSIFGTVVSALGIGVMDQSLQQILGNPVLGKILVLGAIILFLQWKPTGLFATKSRSLEG